MMSQDKIIDWLLSGDVSIQYKVYRDLLDIERPDLRNRIEKEGWGARFLALRKNNGHWGRGFYQPKWISTHYTILDLKNLCITPDCKPIKETLEIVLRDHKGKDGGINPSKTLEQSDVCVNGMALTYLCYFRTPEDALKSIVDFVLYQQMNDGGFNCESNMRGARHSSLHTTISILEGIWEYEKNGYEYRLKELLKAAEEAREFILQHRLFRSDRTGEIIDRKRPHRGVDYAAPADTPIHAIGDGVIVDKGYTQGAGYYLKIRHNSIYVTGYNHLSGYARGIRQRVKVKQGKP